MNRSLVRVAPWLLLLVIAYGLGRWHGRRAALPPANDSRSASPADTVTKPTPPPPTRAETLARELAALHAVARTMATPDARTYFFFEQLTRDDLPVVAEKIRGMPVGNEQDLFFAMVIRRWAQLDGQSALAEASRFPALATRQNAELSAWEAWGMQDSSTAMARATTLPPGRGRDQAIAAVLGGVGQVDPGLALELWKTAPIDFRQAALGPTALDQIVSAACGTGKREVMQTLIAGLPADGMREHLAATLCAEWGAHHPEDALQWLNATAFSDEARAAAMTRIIESLVQRDPPVAAAWGATFPDARRRSSMIAAAVASWVEIDANEAELWINEQSDTRDLDGATFAMAAHFIGARDMQRAFAWIRRISQDEARGELLGNLGRAWSRERPAEFKQFLDQTSLNRAELESLMSKLDPAG